MKPRLLLLLLVLGLCVCCAGTATAQTKRIDLSDVQKLVNLSDPDRKSTRLNSSHSQISYAVFCLKKNRFGELGRDQQHLSPRRLDGRGLPGRGLCCPATGRLRCRAPPHSRPSSPAAVGRRRGGVG